FGTGRVEKRDLALAAVAAVGFLTSRTGNRIGAFLLHADGIRRVPARSGRRHLLALLRSVSRTPRTPPGSDAVASLSEAVRTLRESVPRRGLAVVVSDFLDAVTHDQEPPWGRELRLLAHRQQVLAVDVVDPRDRKSTRLN